MSEQPEPVVRLRAVTKRFGEVTACETVSLELRAGEVHCLLGENSAGKSTLIAMLGGLQRPDEGSIEVDGAEAALGSPAAAIARGIGVVHQHSMLVPTMTVIENLMLAENGGFWLGEKKAGRRLVELGHLLGADIGPRLLVGELGLGQQQQLEIALALWRRPRVLILDEPTSMLGAQAVDALTAGVRRLRDEGVAVLLVTHKLHEALALADTITVLRGGRVTASIAPAELGALGEVQAGSRVLAAMFGSGEDRPDESEPTLGGADPRPLEVSASSSSSSLPLDVASPGVQATSTGKLIQAEEAEEAEEAEKEEAQAVLALERISCKPDARGIALDEVSVRIRAGEILGIAGIDGHGQRQLAEAIAGQRAVTGGSVLLDGCEITGASVAQRQRLGVRYVTDDRLHEGIIGSFSVALNLLLKRVGRRPFWRFGRMNRAAAGLEARRLIEAYDIRTPSEGARAGTLSGGNIQKLLLARELSGAPRAVVFHKPSHGLDLKTVDRVHEAIREFAARGGAALVISTELEELVGLSNRIVVMAGGRIAGEIENDGDRVRERLGELMAGIAAGTSAADTANSAVAS